MSFPSDQETSQPVRVVRWVILGGLLVFLLLAWWGLRLQVLPFPTTVNEEANPPSSQVLDAAAKAELLESLQPDTPARELGAAEKQRLLQSLSPR